MGLFDKKFCDICGEKISFLGNHKLEDGNMCGACNKKMSPFFNGRRKTTVEEMKQHLAEREQNRAKLASFVVGSQFGDSQKIYIDASGQNFMVTYSSPGNFDRENPDILPITAITSCNTEIKENREEEYTKDANGNRVSFNPPRYRYFYDFKITITLNWRWFNEITIKLNSSKVEGMNSAQYHNYEMVAGQARAALLGQQSTPVTSFNGGTYGGSYNNQGGFVQQFVNTVAAGTAGGAVANGAYGNDTAYNGQNTAYGAPNQPFNGNVQNAPYNGQNYGAPNQPVNGNMPNAQQPAVAQGAGWVCPNCGTSNSTAFCGNCGQAKPVAAKFCGNCGWKADGNGAFQFCPQCGTKL